MHAAGFYAAFQCMGTSNVAQAGTASQQHAHSLVQQQAAFRGAHMHVHAKQAIDIPQAVNTAANDETTAAATATPVSVMRSQAVHGDPSHQDDNPRPSRSLQQVLEPTPLLPNPAPVLIGIIHHATHSQDVAVLNASAPAQAVLAGVSSIQALHACLYVAVALMNLTLSSALWGLAASVFGPQASKRLFGFFAAGRLLLRWA